MVNLEGLAVFSQNPSILILRHHAQDMAPSRIPAKVQIHMVGNLIAPRYPNIVNIIAHARLLYTISMDVGINWQQAAGLVDRNALIQLPKCDARLAIPSVLDKLGLRHKLFI